MNILTSTTKEDLIHAIQNNMDDIEMADFAIKLGENGDISYELFLLNNIIEVIKKVYENEDQDSEMKTLVKKLKKLQKLIPLD